MLFSLLFSFLSFIEHLINTIISILGWKFIIFVQEVGMGTLVGGGGLESMDTIFVSLAYG